MFGGQNAMPGDKMLRLFIIQALSSFVSHDYESGLHYINEIKSAYAEYQGQLNPTLKSLAKEIIQSLDMFAPGATSDQFASTNEGTPLNPQDELRMAIQQNVEPQQQEDVHYVEKSEQVETASKSVSNDLQDLLDKRRARREKRGG